MSKHLSNPIITYKEKSIKNRIQANLELDTSILKDIQDCISICEERAFIVGLVEGIKLMKIAEKI